MVSIPLSILCSIAVLTALGQTINTMTLGGLALAVGILVDDSTVAIENTHRLFEEDVAFDTAVLEGSAGIALPTLVSTLAISSVFLAVFFLQGPAHYLFAPLGMAVVFAMLTSYVISRTLTPIIIRLLLRSEQARQPRAVRPAGSTAFMTRFNAGFDRFRRVLCRSCSTASCIIISSSSASPSVVLGGAASCCSMSEPTSFRSVDAGLIQLHVRAPARTRIEVTEQIFHEIENEIRERRSRPSDLDLVLDNIGLPARLYNLAFTDGSTIGVNDGQILVALKEGHAPTIDYIKKLRAKLRQEFPEVLFYFQPADMVTQILNFGIPSQIDVQVQGRDARRRSRDRQAAAAADGESSRPRRRAYSAGARRAAALLCDRPHPRRAIGAQRQQHRDESQHQPELVGTSLAEFLDRSEERHSLLSRGADAGI